jgi:hypothetical protein
MNEHAAVEELLEAAFCVWSVLRLCIRDRQKKLVSFELEVGVDG